MQTDKFLMAIDAGTGSVRAVLFDIAGTQISCVQREWKHLEDPVFPGSMNFDWHHNWELTSSCIRGVLDETGIDPAKIAAVSTTCMREGIVLYDENGQELWACANVDARSNDEVSQLIAKDPELEKEIYRISGQTYALGALPRILWVKNKMPDVYAKIAHISMFNDWLIYKLTGILSSEPSNGCTTGIFDLQKRDWDSSIVENYDLKNSIFPKVYECGTPVGTINAAGSSDTGLSLGTQVIAGGGDAQLGCIGVGVVEPGQAAVFGGSFWQYEFNTGNGKTDDGCRVRVNCHAVPGVWQYEALAFNPGLVLRWYRDAFCDFEKEKGRLSGEDIYVQMDREAAKIPAGSYGMICAFSDVMNYIKWKHASPTFTNFSIDPAKFNRYTFYRSILENTALVTRGHLELVKEATGNIPTEIVFAGGASRSDLWCQILSDVLGMPVKVPVVKEATALGAAILAGYGAGIYASISETAKGLVKWDKTYLPSMNNNEIYSKLYDNWRIVYKAQLELSSAGTTKPMWSAPGV